jgi:hypothetical protein
MKKLLVLVVVAMSMASCVLQKATSSFKEVANDGVLEYPVIADLQIGEKVSYHYVPQKLYRKRLTKLELIQNAMALTLEKHGNADVLLNPQYVFKYKEGSNIREITITGYPAKYVFRKIDSNDIAALNSYYTIPKSPYRKTFKKHKLDKFGYGHPYNNKVYKF